MRCAEHALAFTAYPAGHVPYGREALVAVAPDGSELRDRDGASVTRAVEDASRGERWLRDGAPEGKAVRTTQRRRVREAATLLALADGAVTPALASAVLHLPEGRLVEMRRALAASRDIATWGRAVVGLAEALARRGGRWLMDRFAVLGHIARWWGRPWRWVARPARLVALGKAFWPGTRCRAPP
jgi:hypothetical protein